MWARARERKKSTGGFCLARAGWSWARLWLPQPLSCSSSASGRRTRPDAAVWISRGQRTDRCGGRCLPAPQGASFAWVPVLLLAHGLDSDGLDLLLSRGSHYVLCARQGPRQAPSSLVLSPRRLDLVMVSRAAAGAASQGSRHCPHPTSWRCLRFLARPRWLQLAEGLRAYDRLKPEREPVGHGVLDGQSLAGIMGLP